MIFCIKNLPFNNLFVTRRADDNVQVNNAGIAFGPTGDSVEYENAKDIIDTNYYGVKNVTKGLLPLLRPSPAAARIVNVTTALGVYEVE